MSWRVGRSLGRTLYIGDTVIGIVDNPEQAAVIVHAVNLWLAEGDHHVHLCVERSSFGDDYEKCLGCDVFRDSDAGYTADNTLKLTRAGYFETVRSLTDDPELLRVDAAEAAMTERDSASRDSDDNAHPEPSGRETP